MIPLVVYTHSDYSDIWPLFICNQRKYFDTKIIGVCDKDVEFADQTLIYSSTVSSYRERLLPVLPHLPPVFLFVHEDFILYGRPNLQLLTEYFQIVGRGNADIIKLIRSGDLTLNPKVVDGRILHQITAGSSNQFAIQASIIHRDTLIRLYKGAKGSSIWELEAELQTTAAQTARVYYHWLYEPPRGGHYDSIAYPYTATAVIKGKWNKEYSQELSRSDLVDFSKRGWTE